MKLYTITATPVRSYKQLTDELKKDISRKRDTLRAINARELDFYPETVADILKSYDIDGFTIYPVQGYWQGESEQSFKIEVAETNPIAVADVCALLRDKFNQDAVMLTNPDNSVEFI